jgi:hypothetical protein
MQLFLIYLFIFRDALYVSGGSSAHHQEHITVQKTSRYCQPILLLAATVDEMPPPIIASTKLYKQLQGIVNQYCC